MIVETAAVDLRPVPDPDDTTRFFWDGAREHRLLVQRCLACRRMQYPPDVVCVHCQSPEFEIVETNGRGSLYSFAIVDRPFHPGFAAVLPYVVGVVELEEDPRIRVLTNIVDADASQLRVGMPLTVVFEDRELVTLPQFRPTPSAS